MFSLLARGGVFMRLGLLVTHPIQYMAPLYRALTQMEPTTCVAFIRSVKQEGSSAVIDPGFGKRAGWDIDLLSGYQWTSFNLASGESGAMSFHDLARIPTLVKNWINSESLDVLLIPGWAPHYTLAAETCRYLKVPYIVRPEARPSRSRSQIRRIVRRGAVSRFVKGAGATCAIGSWARDELVRLGIPEARIVSSPYTVDSEWWERQADDVRSMRSHIRQSMGIAEAHTLFVFVGKLAPYKGVNWLLSALQKLNHRRQDWRLLIVGTGPSESEIQDLACRLGLGDQVLFAGFRNQSELPEMYAIADALVLFSSETFGLVVSEAMSAGLPCVVSLDAGVSRDLILDGETGFRVEARDSDSASLALEAMLNPDLRSRLSQAARRVARSRTLDAAAAGILKAATMAQVQTR